MIVRDVRGTGSVNLNLRRRCFRYAVYVVSSSLYGKTSVPVCNVYVKYPKESTWFMDILLRRQIVI